MDLDPTAGTELKKLEKYVRGLASMRNIAQLSGTERSALFDMQDVLNQAVRLHTDATKANKSDEMFVSLEACGEQLGLFREKLLFASQFDLVDAADVAQLSAMSDSIYYLILGR